MVWLFNNATSFLKQELRFNQQAGQVDKPPRHSNITSTKKQSSQTQNSSQLQFQLSSWFTRNTEKEKINNFILFLSNFLVLARTLLKTTGYHCWTGRTDANPRFLHNFSAIIPKRAKHAKATFREQTGEAPERKKTRRSRCSYGDAALKHDNRFRHRGRVMAKS